MKKNWINPELEDLGINMTELGPNITEKHDLVWVDDQGNEYYTHTS